MKTLLYVSASVRPYHSGECEHQSISKMLGDLFIGEFRDSYSQSEVIRRDLSLTPPCLYQSAVCGSVVR